MTLFSNIITISGIFGKSKDLDILPPPPPFPDIEKEHKRIEETEKARRLEEKRKEKELKLKKREEEQEKRRLERERKKAELQFKETVKLQKSKKKVLGSIFSKKKEETELDKELKEIERTAEKPAKKVRKADALEVPEFEFPEVKEDITKPEEVIKAEEEIEKAIKGMKKKPIIKRLFEKKKPEEEKIEMPEVMPRTYDKIDHILLIEERVHKARLALMDFKFDDAKRIYIEVMKMYNDLEPKKKIKVYKDIKDLYYERKSAEKFAK